MPKPKRPKLVDLLIGPFPADTVNLTLDLELEPGNIVLTAGVQKHVQREHGSDYGRCLPHVARVVCDPLYIGDDFRNSGYIEMIARVTAIGTAVLVAVCVEVNGRGQYEVRSFYPVSEQKIANRLGKGFLIRAQKR
jgi:hypothetical protein